MKHNLWILRHEGVRYWLAWKLVQVAHRLKDTTYWQVLKTEGGSAVLIEADSWGSGVNVGLYVNWANDEPVPGYPILRDFDDRDEASDWMHGLEPA